MADATARLDVLLALEDAIAATAQLLALLKTARVMHENGAAPIETLKVLTRTSKVGCEMAQHLSIVAERL